MENPQRLGLHGGLEEQRQQQEQAEKQGVLCDMGPILTEMIPTEDAPEDAQADEMVGIDLFQAILKSGKEQGIEIFAQQGHGKADIFSDDTGIFARGIAAQHIAGKEQEQGHGQTEHQRQPFAIGEAQITFINKDRDKVGQAQEKEKLT